MDNATAKMIWIVSVLHELFVETSFPALLYCDNVGANYMSANPVFHACAKHLEIDYHFVREYAASGFLAVKFTPSKDQLADGMTKPLPTQRLLELRSKLIVLTKPMSLRGMLEPLILADCIYIILLQ